MVRRERGAAALPVPPRVMPLGAVRRGVVRVRPFLGLVFEGGQYSGDVEGWVARAREEMAILLARRLIDTGLLDKVVFVTDRPSLADRAASIAGVDTSVKADEPAASFHFGRRLAQVIGEHDAAGFVYMSGGSGLLMDAAELADFIREAQGGPGIVANNVYSADMFGAANSRVVLSADLPAADNGVPMAVHMAGVPAYGLPPTTGNTFDIDTPPDLLVLSDVIPILAPYAQCVRDAIAVGPVERAIGVLPNARAALARDLAEIALFGRVSPATVADLNSRTTCRLRVYSEERGMRAFGRDKPGMARSLIGRMIQARGPEAFFADLAWCSDAAFIDTRVLFAHMGARLSQEERFCSDLFLWENVRNGDAVRLVQAALDAQIPVMLGGHSLVSGAVRALAACTGRRGVI